VGRWIWNPGRCPGRCVLHTFAGAPWIAKEWLSQLVFCGARRRGGGVAALTAIVSALFALLSMAPSRIYATVASSYALAFTSVYLLARPHVLVFPILIL
jgi:hypothetical protein